MSFTFAGKDIDTSPEQLRELALRVHSLSDADLAAELTALPIEVLSITHASTRDEIAGRLLGVAQWIEDRITGKPQPFSSLIEKLPIAMRRRVLHEMGRHR